MLILVSCVAIRSVNQRIIYLHFSECHVTQNLLLSPEWKSISFWCEMDSKAVRKLISAFRFCWSKKTSKEVHIVKINTECIFSFPVSIYHMNWMSQKFEPDELSFSAYRNMNVTFVFNRSSVTWNTQINWRNWIDNWPNYRLTFFLVVDINLFLGNSRV